jgi:hypothetical protein
MVIRSQRSSSNFFAQVTYTRTLCRRVWDWETSPPTQVWVYRVYYELAARPVRLLTYVARLGLSGWRASLGQIV